MKITVVVADEPQVTILDSGNIQVDAPCRYLFRINGVTYEVTVPKGHICDLSSIPGLLKSFFPNKLKTAHEGLIHDYGYECLLDFIAQLHQQGFRQRTYPLVAWKPLIDAIFDAFLDIDPKVGPVWGWIMWAGVHYFGQHAWDADRKKEQNK